MGTFFDSAEEKLDIPLFCGCDWKEQIMKNVANISSEVVAVENPCD
jgi:hypothetical protein